MPRFEMVERSYGGHKIQQRKADAYIDAQAMAKAHGKRLAHFWENENTQEFVEALMRHTGLSERGTLEEGDEQLNSRESGYLVLTAKGNTGGTFVHPVLGVEVARWCNPDFAVQCNLWNLELLTTGSVRIEGHPAQARPEGVLEAAVSALVAPLRAEVATLREEIEALKAGRARGRTPLIANGLRVIDGPPTTEEERFLAAIRRHDGGISANELHKSNTARYPSASHAAEALNALVAAGKARWVEVPPGPKGGRPTARCVLAGGRTA